MENFDLKKFLVENKLTTNSRMLNESSVEGIDLNLIKALQDEPAVQALHTKFKNNPELAKKAAKLVADIIDRKIPENINETTDPKQTKTTTPSIGTQITTPSPYDKVHMAPEENTNWITKLGRILAFGAVGSILGTVVAIVKPFLDGTFTPPPGNEIIATAILAGLVAAGLGVLGGGHRGGQVEENTTDLAKTVQTIVNVGREL